MKKLWQNAKFRAVIYFFGGAASLFIVKDVGMKAIIGANVGQDTIQTGGGAIIAPAPDTTPAPDTAKLKP